MNTLLAIAEKDYTFNLFDKGYNIGEIALFGLEILGVGILTVFAVLILIWFALVIFEKLFSKAPVKEETEESAPVVVPVAQAPVSAPSTDEEIIAVLAAAIAMAESESNGLKFRVVSFRRK